MEEVFLITQIQTIWISGDKDDAIQRDIIIYLFLFLSFVVFQYIRLSVRYFLLSSEILCLGQWRRICQWRLAATFHVRVHKFHKVGEKTDSIYEHQKHRKPYCYSL